MKEASSHSTTLRWVIGTVVVPVLLALISVAGVTINDILFDPPPPSIESPNSLQLENLNQSIQKLEGQVAVLASILRNERTETEKKAKSNVKRSTAKRKSPPADITANPPDVVQKVPEIEVHNSSVLLGRKLYVGQRTWEWTIYLKAAKEVLEKIKCVTYTLHPTFPDPVVEICEAGKNPNQAFSYQARGWGTFVVDVEIAFRDGTRMNKKHQLVFTTHES